ncbi:10139_t:CDS:2, partial [Gigaspora margarita]
MSQIFEKYMEQTPVSVNEEGTKLITWKQIKFIRGKSCKGKVATWFSLIEKKYLTNPSNREIMLEKCSGCELNLNKGKEVCFSWIWKEDIQGVYPKVQNVANQKVLPVPKEVIVKKKTGNVEALASNLLDPQLTIEAFLARHLVKFQVSNKALFLDLLEALEQNTLNRKEVYKFYMDSFLFSQE